MSSSRLAERLAKCTIQEQAGFAGHLAILAGPDAELPDSLLGSLDELFQMAGIKLGQSAAERQHRFDKYFELWPLPAELRELLDDAAEALAVDAFARRSRAPLLVTGAEGVKPADHAKTRFSDDELFGSKR